MQQAEKDRLAITPLTAADAAADALAAVPAADAVAAVPEADAVAAVPDAVAAVPEVSADWAVVAAVPAAAVPEVSPPVVPVVAVFDPKSCEGSFVAINQPADGDNALFTQPDDAYCEPCDLMPTLSYSPKTRIPFASVNSSPPPYALETFTRRRELQRRLLPRGQVQVQHRSVGHRVARSTLLAERVCCSYGRARARGGM